MKYSLYLWLIALFILHHDFWFADSTKLAFGFIPEGLMYQIAFTLVAAVTWYLISRFAWPKLNDLSPDADDFNSNY